MVLNRKTTQGLDPFRFMLIAVACRPQKLYVGFKQPLFATSIREAGHSGPLGCERRGRLEARGGECSLAAQAELDLEFPDRETCELWRDCNRRTSF
jgi:hypothetical protein